jgi:hypothetical protein
VVVKKSPVENRKSSFRVPSEQLVESWALQGRVEKMALWVQVWSVNQRATASPRKLKNLHSVKSVAREGAPSWNASPCGTCCSPGLARRTDCLILRKTVPFNSRFTCRSYAAAAASLVPSPAVTRGHIDGASNRGALRGDKPITIVQRLVVGLRSGEAREYRYTHGMFYELECAFFERAAHEVLLCWTDPSRRRGTKVRNMTLACCYIAVWPELGTKTRFGQEIRHLCSKSARFT